MPAPASQLPPLLVLGKLYRFLRNCRQGFKTPARGGVMDSEFLTGIWSQISRDILEFMPPPLFKKGEKQGGHKLRGGPKPTNL